MTYAFKAGETYQTRNGTERLIAYISPSDLTAKSGSKYRMICVGHKKEVYAHTIDGKAVDANCDMFDLMPPKRQVWVAVWDDGCRIQADPWESESGAEMWAQPSPANESVRRIAVLGPIDVEVEP